MRIKCLAQGHYCRCQQIQTRDLTIDSLWSYPPSHNSSSICSQRQNFCFVLQWDSEKIIKPSNCTYLLWVFNGMQELGIIPLACSAFWKRFKSSVPNWMCLVQGEGDKCRCYGILDWTLDSGSKGCGFDSCQCLALFVLQQDTLSTLLFSTQVYKWVPGRMRTVFVAWCGMCAP